jgi:hypothetical protein
VLKSDGTVIWGSDRSPSPFQIVQAMDRALGVAPQ